MKVFILTYNENVEQAIKLKNDMEKHNFPIPSIINKLPRCDKLHIPGSKIIFLQFLWYILPEMNDDTLFFEDDAIVNKDFELFKKQFDRGLVSRIGYGNKIPKNYPEPPNFIQGSHCVGFKKEVLPKLKDYMWKNYSKPVHFDRFLCNFRREKLTDDEYYIPLENEKICGYTEHYTIISGNKVKKGLKL